MFPLTRATHVGIPFFLATAICVFVHPKVGPSKSQVSSPTSRSVQQCCRWPLTSGGKSYSMFQSSLATPGLKAARVSCLEKRDLIFWGAGV